VQLQQNLVRKASAAEKCNTNTATIILWHTTLSYLSPKWLKC